LHEQIALEGAVVSEFSIGIPPDATHFPRRNRIISGLSRAVIVTEAPLRSGALITARVANEQNRDVYAVPGDITREQSTGVNRLIADGAQVVTGGDELLVSLGLATSVSVPGGDRIALPVEIPDHLTGEDRAIVEALTVDPVHIDDLATKLGKDTSDLLTSLTLLEMQGLAEAHSGSRFARAVITG
jgi:DNA processing protein